MARSMIRELQVEDIDFLSEVEHEGFHNSDRYIEVLRSSGRIAVINEWLNLSKTHKISSTYINRINGLISTTVKDIYDHETGSFVISTISGTVSRQGRRITSILYERNNDIDTR